MPSSGCAKSISRPETPPAWSRASFTWTPVACAAVGARRIRSVIKHFSFAANDGRSRTIGRQHLYRADPTRTSDPAIPRFLPRIVRFDGPHAAALLNDQPVRQRVAGRPKVGRRSSVIRLLLSGRPLKPRSIPLMDQGSRRHQRHCRKFRAACGTATEREECGVEGR